jgi:hypothetical protein
VARDHGRQRELLRFEQPLRRVREQDRVGQAAPEHVRDLADLVGPEPDAGHVEGLAADRQPRARVLEHREPLRRQRRRHVAVVVVVAEDCDDPVRRRERRERFRRRLDEARVAPRHVVATEHDQIRLFRHQHAHGRRDQLVRDRLAAVDVGQHADAQAAQRLGQPGDRHRGARDLEMVPLVQIPVRRGAGGRTDADADERLQHDAAVRS